jgi:short-subunit dehydrogenase
MKTVLITGASRGLGFSLAKIFLSNEYHLILNSRNIEPSLNDKIDIVKGDLRGKSTINSMRRIIKEKDVDIIINNAAIYKNNQLNETDIDDFHRIFEVNLLVPIKLIKAIWPIFQKKQSGLIININSVAGKRGSSGELAYCASKFGLRGFSESLKCEAKKHGIRIIDVYPGAMKTDMSIHRPDYDNLICPCEVAKTIYNFCENYKSMNISEIEITRRNYA